MNKLLLLPFLLLATIAPCQKSDTELANEACTNLAWQWQNCRSVTDIGVSINGKGVCLKTPNHPLLALKLAIRDGKYDEAMQVLKNGQSHNKNAQSVLDEARRRFGENGFWALVSSASAMGSNARAKDLSKVRQNLSWLAQNRKDAVDDALSHYAAYEKDKSNKREMLLGNIALLDAQDHNAGAQLDMMPAMKESNADIQDFIRILREERRR